MIGLVISAGKATMTELSTTAGLEDLHDLVEMVLVDAHNARVDEKRRKEG